MTEATRDYADTIAKLLTKAESTTPEEAEALSAKAFAMMTKYSIAQSAIDARRKLAGGESEKVVEKMVKVTGSFAGPLRDMAESIVSGLKTTAVYRRFDGGRNKSGWVVIVGFESDVDQTILLIESMFIQAATAMAAWWKTNDERTWFSSSEAWREKKEFIRGFSFRMFVRLRDARIAVEEESGPGTALALRDRGKVAQDQVDAMNLKSPRKTSETGGSWRSNAAGSAAADSADMGQRRMGSTKAIG